MAEAVNPLTGRPRITEQGIIPVRGGGGGAIPAATPPAPPGGYAEGLRPGTYYDALTAFHYSPQEALTELRASERGPLGPGVYLTPNTNTVNQYKPSRGGGQRYEHKMNESEYFQGTPSGHPESNRFEVWRNQIDRLVKAAEPEKKDAVAELGRKLGPEDGYPLFVRLSQLYKGDEGAQALIKRAGFKGMTAYVDGPEVVHYGSLPMPAAKPTPDYSSGLTREKI